MLVVDTSKRQGQGRKCPQELYVSCLNSQQGLFPRLKYVICLSHKSAKLSKETRPVPAEI